MCPSPSSPEFHQEVPEGLKSGDDVECELSGTVAGQTGVTQAVMVNTAKENTKHQITG